MNVSQPCTVLIGASDLLPDLTKRAHDAATELLTFADTDALRALDVITKRRPRVVALERVFAATPRGAALITRIKADPSLTHAEIRVVSHDSNYMRVSPAAGAADDRDGSAVAAATLVAPPIEVPIDQRGTRRAPRFRLQGKIDLLVDGNAAVLIDLSTLGAQVVSSGVLKPSQRVRFALSDEGAVLRFNASVAWASFEIPVQGGPRYRAGLEFVDADGGAVDAICGRHR